MPEFAYHQCFSHTIHRTYMCMPQVSYQKVGSLTERIFALDNLYIDIKIR